MKKKTTKPNKNRTKSVRHRTKIKAARKRRARLSVHGQRK